MSVSGRIARVPRRLTPRSGVRDTPQPPTVFGSSGYAPTHPRAGSRAGGPEALASPGAETAPPAAGLGGSRGRPVEPPSGIAIGPASQPIGWLEHTYKQTDKQTDTTVSLVYKPGRPASRAWPA